jgi:transposase
MLGELLGMAKKHLPDELWGEIAPLIPPDPSRPKGGRPPVPARDALIGILFVLCTAIPWERLPFEVAGCSGMICWRRLRAWQEAGV